MDFIEAVAVPIIGFAVGPAAIIPLGIYLTHLAFIELIAAYGQLQAQRPLPTAQEARRRRQIEIQIIANGIIAQLQAEEHVRDPAPSTLSTEHSSSASLHSSAAFSSGRSTSSTLSSDSGDLTLRDETTTVGSPTDSLMTLSIDPEHHRTQQATILTDTTTISRSTGVTIAVSRGGHEVIASGAEDASDSETLHNESSSDDETSSDNDFDLASLPHTSDRSVSGDETIVDDRQQYDATGSSTISAHQSRFVDIHILRNSEAAAHSEAMVRLPGSSYTSRLSPITSRHRHDSSIRTPSTRSGSAYEYSMPVTLQLLTTSHDRCIGTTKKGSRCRNPINALSRQAISMTIQALSIRTSLPTLEALEELAEHALCNHWHGNKVNKLAYYQGRRVASEWLGEYHASRRRSQAPSPRTPGSTMRSFDFDGSNRSTPMSETDSVFSRTSSRSSFGGSPSPSPMRRRC